MAFIMLTHTYISLLTSNIHNMRTHKYSIFVTLFVAKVNQYLMNTYQICLDVQVKEQIGHIYKYL